MHASAQLIFSFIVSLGLPSPGNGDTHNGQAIHLTVVKTVSHRHASGPFSRSSEIVLN